MKDEPEEPSGHSVETMDEESHIDNDDEKSDEDNDNEDSGSKEKAVQDDDYESDYERNVVNSSDEESEEDELEKTDFDEQAKNVIKWVSVYIILYLNFTGDADTLWTRV